MSSDDTSPPTRDPLRPLRYLWRVPWLLLHVLLGVLLCAGILTWNRHSVMRNGREPFAHRLIRGWSTRLLRIFGLRSVRIGQPLADPVLFVANHTSWIDIVMLHSQRAACFVAKAEIARWPLVGWLAACGGTIFHRRGSNHSLAAVMQIMVERLREGRSVAVFPEGGTGYGGELKVFHARIFQAALDAQVPVQPVALRFVDRASGRDSEGPLYIGDDTLVGSLWRTLAGRPFVVHVHFGEPQGAHGRDRRQWAQDLRAAVEALRASRPDDARG
jgi:1-acyl-sn-glycerol-3-phosphate acyltransferase